MHYNLLGACPVSGSIFNSVMHPNQRSSIMYLWHTASVSGSELVAFTVTQREVPAFASICPFHFSGAPGPCFRLGLPAPASVWGSWPPLPSGAPGPCFRLEVPSSVSIYQYRFFWGFRPLLSSGDPGPRFRLGLPAPASVWGSRPFASVWGSRPALPSIASRFVSISIS